MLKQQRKDNNEEIALLKDDNHFKEEQVRIPVLLIFLFSLIFLIWTKNPTANPTAMPQIHVTLRVTL